MRLASILLLFVLAANALAHTTITDKLITLHDGQTVPRYASLPGNNLVVPAGQTVTLPADSTFDAIEVSGTLLVSRGHDTVCRFTNLQILPGGKLDMGSANDPVLKRVDFIVRSVPINTQLDPHQWGHGIFNLGTWTAHGRAINQTWSTMKGVAAGASELTVTSPVNWQVGDELLIPDTRQMSVYPWSAGWVNARRESPVRIAAIAGNLIKLTKSLDFEHEAAMSPPLATPNPTLAGDYTLDGKVDQADRAFWCSHFSETSGVGLQADGDKSGKVDGPDFDIWKANFGNTLPPAGEGQERVERFKPYVANITRNITIRSENPAGVRGHTVSTGEKAVQDLQYVAFAGLGRTTAAKLNNSNGTAPGTNQVGRYALHLHHVHSPTPSYHRGLAVSDSPKWGIVVHGTHDTKTEWCVVDQCVGAGIVTEDGPEVRNTFSQNFVMGSTGGVLTDFPTFLVDGKQGVFNGQPGSEGAGFWFHGLGNRINGNVSMNNKVGIAFVHFGALTYNYPSQPGGPMDTAYDKFSPTLEFDRNVTAANLLAGTETWQAAVTATNLDAWHNGGGQIVAAEDGSFSLNGARCLAQGWITEAVASNGNYIPRMKITNSRLEGCAVGCLPAFGSYELTSSTLYNKTNIDWRKGPDAAPRNYHVDCRAIPAPGGTNFLIDWEYDKTKINLDGAPYEEQPQ